MIAHIVELPEDAIPSCAFEVVGYLDSDGEMAYVGRIQGDVPLSTMIGLIEMAKADAIAANRGVESDE